MPLWCRWGRCRAPLPRGPAQASGALAAEVLQAGQRWRKQDRLLWAGEVLLLGPAEGAWLEGDRDGAGRGAHGQASPATRKAGEKRRAFLPTAEQEGPQRPDWEGRQPERQQVQQAASRPVARNRREEQRAGEPSRQQGVGSAWQEGAPDRAGRGQHPPTTGPRPPATAVPWRITPSAGTHTPLLPRGGTQGAFVASSTGGGGLLGPGHCRPSISQESVFQNRLHRTFVLGPRMCKAREPQSMCRVPCPSAESTQQPAGAHWGLGTAQKGLAPHKGSACVCVCGGHC